MLLDGKVTCKPFVSLSGSQSVYAVRGLMFDRSDRLF